MDMTFETKNVRSFYRSFSLKTVAKELAKYKFRRTFQPKWEEVKEAGENSTIRSFIICTLCQILSE
jgi:hypothetical protein